MVWFSRLFHNMPGRFVSGARCPFRRGVVSLEIGPGSVIWIFVLMARWPLAADRHFRLQAACRGPGCWGSGFAGAGLCCCGEDGSL